MAKNDRQYQEQLSKGNNEFEDCCKLCGLCCGADNDPCLHLKQQSNGTWICEIYPTRLGWRKTVGGNRFKCVPIRENMRIDALPPGCGYRRK